MESKASVATSGKHSFNVPIWEYLKLWNTWRFDGNTYEPPRDKTNKVTCAASKDSDQPGHPPSLIRVFAVRPMGS